LDKSINRNTGNNLLFRTDHTVEAEVKKNHAGLID